MVGRDNLEHVSYGASLELHIYTPDRYYTFRQGTDVCGLRSERP